MGGWSPGYRVSKASLNAMTRILSIELDGEGFKVNSACPGFVNRHGRAHGCSEAG